MGSGVGARRVRIVEPNSTEILPHANSTQFDKRCPVFVVGTHFLAPLRTTSLVNVMLQDSTAGGATGNMRTSVVDDIVKGGHVMFRAFNQSKELIHRDELSKLIAKMAVLPYDEKIGKVEAQVQRLGEFSDLKPGATGTIALKLGAGLLPC